MKKLLLVGALGLMLAGLTAPQAHAGGFTVTVTQQGTNVVSSGSGVIDLTGWSLVYSAADGGGACPDLYPQAPELGVGGNKLCDAFTPGDEYEGSTTGPASFGPGPGASPNSTSGDVFDFYGGGATSLLTVPAGYVSGEALSDITTFDNTTLASIGAAPGSYVWTWGTGANQSITVDVGGSSPNGVPEPSALALFGAGLLGLSVLRRRRKAI